MKWFMLKDLLKIQIGNVPTEIQKDKESIYITTTVHRKQSPTKWVDSSIVDARNFKPIYHSYFHQQRAVVLNFGENITGYYLDKQAETKTQISEEVDQPFFDSNF
jgi:hypothetical protein